MARRIAETGKFGRRKVMQFGRSQVPRELWRSLLYDDALDQLRRIGALANGIAPAPSMTLARRASTRG